MARMATVLGRNELNEAEVIRFDVLPDDVLLDVFDLYVDHDPTSSSGKKEVEIWRTLVHVCRRWRTLVFRSPRRLDLRLFCTPETCMKETLDVWPALPLIVQGDTTLLSGTSNIIAILEQSNRVRRVNLWGFADRQLEIVLAMMQIPFPELTDVQLYSHHVPPSAQYIVPDSFLGGSALRLRYISLNGIPFPGLPKLLSSATHLVQLSLSKIPHSGYISPRVMVASLSALPVLESIDLEFEYYRSPPDWETRGPPQSKRSVLPALDRFGFNGNTKYLEDLVSRIDTPQLDHLSLDFSDQTRTSFGFRQLTQFVSRIVEHRKCDIVHVRFGRWITDILLGTLQVSCNLDRRLSFAAQVCGSSILSMVEDLYIERRFFQFQPPEWDNDGVENIWLQVLLPFTAVKNLYLDEVFAPCVAAALQQLVGERITGIFLSLQNIFVHGLEQFEKYFAQFVVARQLSGHPISISDWLKTPNVMQP